MRMLVAFYAIFLQLCKGILMINVRAIEQAKITECKDLKPMGSERERERESERERALDFVQLKPVTSFCQL